MRRRALLLGLGALAALPACGTPSWAPDEELALRRYRHPGASSLTLVTVRNSATRSGAHTALLISASERVLFDPAGTWTHPSIPERNDLLYGMSPEALDLYLSYHARESYFVQLQEIDVPAEVAEQAFALARVRGPVGMARCTIATAGILRELPGFEGLPATVHPAHLAHAFGRLPGVRERELHEDDPDDGRAEILRSYTPLPAAGG